MAKIRMTRKRDGRIVPFDQEKITNAIFKAAQSVGGKDRELSKKLSDEVVSILEKKYGDKPFGVEEIQDVVEKVLIEGGHARTSKSYILYRETHKKLREARAAIGVQDDLKLSINALKVLEQRYLKRDKNRKVIETPSELFARVAANIAEADKFYGKSGGDIRKTEEEFYRMMAGLEFMPNSPTLMNAGRDLQQLSACFVLPVPDSMDGIFDSLKCAALVHQSGGGTGFSFTDLRPKGDIVKSTGGIASGPVTFMRVFNTATDVIKQGGTRRGANMGILRVDHPDILEFITAKEKEGQIDNFNISVVVTKDFMEAVKKGEEYNLINPRTCEVVSRLNAKSVFDLMVTMAWKNGEPGIIFIDRINEDNPTPKLGKIMATNPCGEQPLLPYEACNLGSINLNKMLRAKNGKYEIDYEKLRETIQRSVHFLDNVIDMSKFPIDKIRDTVHGNRKIGLGVMGWADLLVTVGIPYNSEEATKLAEKVMSFIHEESVKASQKLAEERGVFPNWKGSVWGEKGTDIRNATVNTIAPTGSISIITNCSSGVEPLFAVSYIRRIMDGMELIEMNPHFERMARERKFYDENLIKKITKRGTIQHIDEIPEDIRRVFVTAHDIQPEWHVRMQAAFQKYTDNAVSKTINFPADATIDEVRKAYMLCYELGCKGITVYRDRSREKQVLNIEEMTTKSAEGSDPAFSASSEYAGGCTTCTI